MGLPRWLSGKKNPPAQQETWVWSLGWEDPLEKEMANYSSRFLPGKSHEQRNLTGYIVHGGHKELDTTLQLNNNNID